MKKKEMLIFCTKTSEMYTLYMFSDSLKNTSDYCGHQEDFYGKRNALRLSSR